MYTGASQRFAMRFHLLCVHSLFLSFCVVGCNLSSEPEIPLEKVTIEMTGEEFQWQSRYAGPDGELQSPDDVVVTKVIHVPVGADVEIILQSRDYIYSLEVPQHSLKEIAVPDLTFKLQFKPAHVGEYVLPGAQMCGYTHPDLMTTLIVDEPAAYRRWWAEQQ